MTKKTSTNFVITIKEKNMFDFYLVDEDGEVTGTNDPVIVAVAVEDSSWALIIDVKANRDLTMPGSGVIKEQTTYQL